MKLIRNRFIKTIILIAIFAIFLTAKINIAQSTSEIIGKIGNVDPASGEIFVNVPSTSAMIEMGDLLFVKINEDIVVLRATFPMQTMSKCKLLPNHRNYFSKLTRGMEVFKYYRGVEKDGEEAAVMPGKPGEIRKIGLIDFIYIPDGTFLMGSPEGEGNEDENPQHKVAIDGFWMSKHEVTQKQYKTITGTNPSKFKGKPDNPVEQVSWQEAKIFCDQFSERYGVTVRLPFEAEWEYAARSGTNTKYYWGDSSETDIVNQYAVYGTGSSVKEEKNNGYGTHKVGTKKPNSFGLYDMSGNVSEFCKDWYDDWDGQNYYTKSAAKNPNGAWSGTNRVVRGGSWSNEAGLLRSASRRYTIPRNISEQYGFRLVLVPVK